MSSWMGPDYSKLCARGLLARSDLEVVQVAFSPSKSCELPTQTTSLFHSHLSLLSFLLYFTTLGALETDHKHQHEHKQGVGYTV